jgi:predicted O-methyltransferase YrrM
MEKLNLLFRYCKYKIFSRHKYGHGIHSPFIFDLITKVFNDKFRYEEYDEVEKMRDILSASDKEISVTEYGAGSKILGTESRKIKDIVKYSSVNRKFGRLLFRLVKYFNPGTVLELGTSLGISTMYMAKASKNTRVISIEGDRQLARFARQNFHKASLLNIDVINNSFENALPGIIKGLDERSFIFIDGNHEKGSTLQYFNQLSVKSGNNLIILFDDINWSAGMQEAWQQIKASPKVKITIDLFFMGIVFFKKGIEKQNFVIRY